MTSLPAFNLTAADFRRHAAERNEWRFKAREGIREFKDFPAARATLIVTCMDPRVQPHEFWDLEGSPAGVIRIAGGRAVDVLRSGEILTAAMGTGHGTVGTIVIVHHTDCGMLSINEQGVKDKLLERNPDLTAEQKAHLHDKRFYTATDLEQAVKEDIALIKADPYLAADLEVIGFIYDTFTGKTHEVVH